MQRMHCIWIMAAAVTGITWKSSLLSIRIGWHPSPSHLYSRTLCSQGHLPPHSYLLPLIYSSVCLRSEAPVAVLTRQKGKKRDCWSRLKRWRLVRWLSASFGVRSMLCGCANLGGQLPPSHWRYLWHWSWICPQLRLGRLCRFVHGGYDSVERSERARGEWCCMAGRKCILHLCDLVEGNQFIHIVIKRTVTYFPLPNEVDSS